MDKEILNDGISDLVVYYIEQLYERSLSDEELKELLKQVCTTILLYIQS